MSKKINSKLLNEIAEILTVENERQICSRKKLEENINTVEKIDKQFSDVIKLQENILYSLKNSYSKNAISLPELEDNIRKTKSSLETEKIHFDSKEIEVLDTTDDWDKNLCLIREYAKNKGIDLSNPYYSMFSKTEIIQINHQLVEKFELCRLDTMDYYMAAATGVIAGMVDIILVGTVGNNSSESILQQKVDQCFDKVVMCYAKLERTFELKKREKEACLKSPNNKKEIQARMAKELDKMKAWDKKQSISYLERRHKVNYDLSTNDGDKPWLNPSNHHLLSFAHEPSILGLIVGLMDQLTGKITLISPETGKIIREEIETSQIGVESGKKLIGSIGNAVQNWFGHVMSDIAGSSGSKGRGAGLPVPGWAALEKMQFGSIPINGKDMTIANVAEWLYKNGYDVRAYTAQLIPVLVNEALIRTYWFMKQHFYYGYSLKDSLPIANTREVARLLLISTATFSSLDLGHAYLKSGKGVDLAKFLLTMNIPGLIDFGFRAVQNIRNEVEHRKYVEHMIDTDIEEEWSRIIQS